MPEFTKIHGTMQNMLEGTFSKYGSLACNFCVNQAFYFWLEVVLVVSVTCNRWCKSQSVTQMLFVGSVDVQWQQH
jgi:hypothetical protein